MEIDNLPRRKVQTVTGVRTPVPVVTGEIPGLPGVNISQLGAQRQFGPLGSYLMRRGLAFAIDLVAVGLVLASILHEFFRGAFNPEGAVPLFGLRAPLGTPSHYYEVIAFALIGAHVLVWFGEALFGTTVGKLVVALSVRRTRGENPGFFRTFVRGLLRPLDFLLIGELLIALTPRRQRFGDLLAGTVVARSPLGAFAPLIGIGALAGLGWLQFFYGGGLDTIAGIGTDTARYTPTLMGHVLGP